MNKDFPKTPPVAPAAAQQHRFKTWQSTRNRETPTGARVFLRKWRTVSLEGVVVDPGGGGG